MQFGERTELNGRFGNLVGQEVPFALLIEQGIQALLDTVG